MVDIGWLISSFLMVAGAIGVIVLWLDLFTAVGYQARRLRAAPNPAGSGAGIPPVDSQDFLLTAAGIIDRTVQAGGQVAIARNGDEFLDVFLSDIRRAQQTITATSYIWQAGRMHERILQALAERVKAGVQVRVLLDGHGGQSYLRRWHTEIEKAGIAVGIFRPLRFGTIFRFHHRSHRRAFVIDGKIGYTGGLAIHDTWLGKADHPGVWRDYMFRTTGPMAHAIQAAFAELWVSATGEILAGPSFYAPLTPADRQGSAFISVASSPSFDLPSLDKFWWLSIMAARRSIYIMSPFITVYQSLLGALRQQARSGVDVCLVLPGDHFDNHQIRIAGHYHYQALLTDGVRIYEYQPAMMHSKLFIIDGVWSIIGSANFDIRSIRLNEEIVIGIQDKALAQELTHDFWKDVQQSQEIDIHTWPRRGLWRRGKEMIYRLFEEQY